MNIIVCCMFYSTVSGCLFTLDQYWKIILVKVEDFQVEDFQVC